MSHQIPIFHALQVAHSALFRAADKHTRQEAGLTTTQVAVLFLLSRKDGQPIGDLARALEMGKSSLTGLIDRMSAAGLVERREAEGDGRKSIICLTNSGQILAQSAKQKTKAFNSALLKPFSEAEIETISRFLKHISDNAEPIINNASTRK